MRLFIFNAFDFDSPCYVAVSPVAFTPLFAFVLFCHVFGLRYARLCVAVTITAFCRARSAPRYVYVGLPGFRLIAPVGYADFTRTLRSPFVLLITRLHFVLCHVPQLRLIHVLIAVVILLYVLPAPVYRLVPFVLPVSHCLHTYVVVC